MTWCVCGNHVFKWRFTKKLTFFKLGFLVQFLVSLYFSRFFQINYGRSPTVFEKLEIQNGRLFKMYDVIVGTSWLPLENVFWSYTHHMNFISMALPYNTIEKSPGKTGLKKIESWEWNVRWPTFTASKNQKFDFTDSRSLVEHVSAKYYTLNYYTTHFFIYVRNIYS